MTSFTAKTLFTTFVANQISIIMKQFTKTAITPKADKVAKLSSKTLSFKSDVKVSDIERKLLESLNTGSQEASDPHAPTLSVYPFLVIISSFVSFRKHVVSLGKRHFTPDMFIILMLVASSGRKGLSATSCCKLFCVVRDSGTSVRNVNYKLFALVSCKLLSKSSTNRFYISVHAEKLLTKSISKSEFKDLHKIVRAFSK